jgi:hypothetical protein
MTMDGVLIYDLGDPSGAAELWTHAVQADEMIARDPRRYVRKLPLGTKLGPKCGPDHRVVIS